MNGLILPAQIDWPRPDPLFNPLTAETWGTPAELLAGPLGLAAFLPLVPLVRVVGRRFPRIALAGSSVAWVAATAGPLSAVLLAAFIAGGAAWVHAVSVLRDDRRLSERGAVALIWIGLAAMIAPLWWQAQWSWYGWGWAGSPWYGSPPLRTQVLHNLGFAYLFVRMVAWGVDRVRGEAMRGTWRETLCWLLYAPCQRLGPVMRRQAFVDRLHEWKPRAAPPWREIGRRLGLCLLGAAALFALESNTPHVAPGAEDFFRHPELYATDKLIRVVIHVPVLIYLILWTYNELAAATALWIGIPVDNNFHWLPAATSVRDFWRRWHVTLGAWLREYIYIPLGGNRGPAWLHIAAVFLFCAVWHGPSVSFLVWGASQTAALTVQRAWDRLRGRAGWTARLRGPLWVGACWLATMAYQSATILAFADFEYFGVRIYGELLRRAIGAA